MAKKFYKESEIVFSEPPIHGNFKDLTNQIYGRLCVLGYFGKNKNNNHSWICRCTCGNVTKVYSSHLKNGDSTSCGCYNKEKLITHGYAIRGKNDATYTSWRSMLARCQNPNNTAYSYYGERGIKVCERWFKFENFLADMGERPKGLTLERIENDKGYYQTNCKWATRKEQNNNTRSNVFVTYNGKTQTISEWARESNMNHSCLLRRINKGWPVEKALTMPPIKTNPSKSQPD